MQNSRTSIDVINRKHEAFEFFFDFDKSDLWEDSPNEWDK